jgi:hypothetical protein
MHSIQVLTCLRVTVCFWILKHAGVTHIPSAVDHLSLASDGRGVAVVAAEVLSVVFIVLMNVVVRCSGR